MLIRRGEKANRTKWENQIDQQAMQFREISSGIEKRVVILREPVILETRMTKLRNSNTKLAKIVQLNAVWRSNWSIKDECANRMPGEMECCWMAVKHTKNFKENFEITSLSEILGLLRISKQKSRFETISKQKSTS
jgi:hypothetical protein